ncbi:MAG: hypothetical protein J6P71_03955, partial [Oscillospiraceae bacterium]|nr:hypothetical protein [Oscillospiraceae bacterium]
MTVRQLKQGSVRLKREAFSRLGAVAEGLAAADRYYLTENAGFRRIPDGHHFEGLPEAAVQDVYPEADGIVETPGYHKFRYTVSGEIVNADNHIS